MIKQRVMTELKSQFGRPHGPLGWVAGRMMERRNATRAAATVDLLDLAPDARVLELGHGPGIALRHALDAAPDGHVVGVEHSEVMSRMARRRNAAAVAAGRLELVVADVERPPPTGLRGFDVIFSCNVWLFWSTPVATLEQWRERLAPGGTMAIVHRPPAPDATAADTAAAGERIAADLADAGYADIRCEPLDLEGTPGICVLGRTPSAA